ncbi:MULTISPECIES: porin [Sphingobacterium]|uniref:Porin n=1 Tax=Sphingobacterium populi TaxID=1812824 RepID=A0ABW5U8H0_9SPHI|nr:porin [Sphingobacterium sp. CFCC 11742]
MKHLLALFFISILALPVWAQDDREALIPKLGLNQVDTTAARENDRSQLFNFDFLMRSAFDADNLGREDALARFNLEEARILFHGDYNDRLSYNIRFRLNRSFSQSGLDNSSQALDFAFMKYKFGKNNDWAVTLGKQSAMVGSYEFQNNPIYEFLFTDYVDRILNLFVVGGKLSYDLNADHSFHVQMYNTVNNTFDTHLANNGFVAGDLRRAKAPIGGYLTWIGAFADQRFHTKWSYNLAQFAEGKPTQAISLANKFLTDRQMVYLDLQYSHLGVDHALIASNAINDFYSYTGAARQLAQNIVYKSAVLRYDQFLTDKWELALKGAIETAGSGDDDTFGKDFRTNYTYFAALQHKPFPNQDLRFYLGYIGNNVTYADRLNLDPVQFSRIAVGGYFTIPIY